MKYFLICGYSLGFILIGFLFRGEVWRHATLLFSLWLILPLFAAKFIFRKKKKTEPGDLPKCCSNEKCRYDFVKVPIAQSRAVAFGKCPKCGEDLCIKRKEAVRKIRLEDMKFIPFDRGTCKGSIIFLSAFLILSVLSCIFLVPHDGSIMPPSVKIGNQVILIGIIILAFMISIWIGSRFFKDNSMKCPVCGNSFSYLHNNLVRLTGNCPHCGGIILSGISEEMLPSVNPICASELKRSRLVMILVTGAGIVFLLAGLIGAGICLERQYPLLCLSVPVSVAFMGLVFSILMLIQLTPKCPVCGKRIEDFNTVLSTKRCPKCANIIVVSGREC